MRHPRKAILTPGLLGVLAVALVVVGIILTAKNWTHGSSWDLNDQILIVVRWTSGILGLAIGWWWWWRAPANPTGRLLYLAAVADWVFLITYSWPGSQLAVEVTWFGVVTYPCVALILLSWPTGRPTRRTVRIVLAVAVADLVLVLVGSVFSRTPHPSSTWPDPLEARFTDPTVWHVIDPIQALGLNAVPAAVILVVLVRRRHAVPPAVRPLITPITIAGVLIAASFIVLHVGFQLFNSLLSTDAAFSVWQMLTLLGSYFTIGFVALGVLIGATRRRRAVALGSRYREVDLRSAPAVISPSAAAAATVGDPSVRVRYPRPDGTWIDSMGAPLPEVAPHRRLLPVLDETATVIAALEISESVALSPLLADLAVGMIAARSANERAAALADARRADVRARSRDLIAATDTGRRDLERNLHDGAQQLLVGLALTAGLAARRGTDSADDHDQRTQTMDRISDVRREILALIDSATPAALSGGLAGALHALAAVCPITVVVDARGDLPADDPLALNLYLAAGEAITNAVKHADARTVTVYFAAGDDDLVLSVSDDGLGAVAAVPPSISRRVAAIGGAVDIDSPAGEGTAIRVRVQRRVLVGTP